MAWEDVVTKLKFWGTRPTPADAFDPDGTQGLIGAVSRGAYAGILEFSREQKIAVLDALAEFYNNPNCTEARAVLDTAGDIWFVNTTGYGSGTVTPGNTRTLGIDFNQVSTTKWMGADGSFKAERLGGLAIHELMTRHVTN